MLHVTLQFLNKHSKTVFICLTLFSNRIHLFRTYLYTTAVIKYCVAAMKHLSVFHFCIVNIFLSFGIIPSGHMTFLNWIYMYLKNRRSFNLG